MTLEACRSDLLEDAVCELSVDLQLRGTNCYFVQEGRLVEVLCDAARKQALLVCKVRLLCSVIEEGPVFRGHRARPVLEFLAPAHQSLLY